MSTVTTYYPWFLWFCLIIPVVFVITQVVDYEAGIWIFQVQSLGPGSRRRTLLFGSADKWLASTQPAQPAPQMRYSCVEEHIISDVDLKHFLNLETLPEDENTRIEQCTVCKQENKILMKQDSKNGLNGYIGRIACMNKEFHRCAQANYLRQLWTEKCSQLCQPICTSQTAVRSHCSLCTVYR